MKKELTLQMFRDDMLDVLHQHSKKMDERFDAMDERFEGVDRHFERLEKRVDAMGVLLETLIKQVGGILTMLKEQQEKLQAFEFKFASLEVRVARLEKLR